MYERKKIVTIFDNQNPKSVSKTKQCFKNELDINLIVKKYRKTGEFNDNIINRNQPMIGDFTDLTDFQALASVVSNVNKAFMSLPAETRAKFRHSPALALEFVSLPENKEEARILGMIPPLTDEEKRLMTIEAQKAHGLPPEGQTPPLTGA